MKKMRLASIWLNLLILSIVTVGALSAAPPAILDELDAAQARGELSAEEALLYKFHYVFDQSQLPAAYRPATFEPLKSATAILFEYETSRDDLTARTVEVIQAYLAPKDGPKATFYSPSGRFQLTYYTTGSNAVPAADANSNGTPDFVENCADYLDYSWDFEIDTLGFTRPPSTPYQVYFESMSSYGYTSPGSGPASTITLHNTFIGFPPNDDPDGDQWGAAKVTCAHEFKHASQRATSYWSEGGWVEVDATWMEDIAYDQVNDYYNYLPGGSGISHPTQPLNYGGTGSYDDCIWQHWMSETWGEQIIVDFWDWRSSHTSQHVLYSYDQILQNYGSSIADGFPIYAAWNFMTGTRATVGLGYEEANRYPSAPATSVATYPRVTSGSISNLAANFFFCYNFGDFPGTFDIDFDGQNGRTMGLVAMIRKLDGSGLMEVIQLDGDNDAEISLSVPVEEIHYLGVIVANSALSGSASYSLTMDVTETLPEPLAQVTPSSVAMTLLPDSLDYETVILSNAGEAGSVMDYAISVTDLEPSAKTLTRFADLVESRPNPGLDKSGIAPEMEFAPAIDLPRYAGDCVFGNDDVGDLYGYRPNWWSGNESYAHFISPSDEACSCNPGFNLRAIHMLLFLYPGSAPEVRVHLAVAGGSGCPEPGNILASSPPMTVSGISAYGYYDIEVPCDFPCFDMDEDYFLIFEFLDDNATVGIAVDTAGETCVNYNDYGSGYEDLVDEHGFSGDLLIWADADCCGVAVPEIEVLEPDGGEVLDAGEIVPLGWTATVVSDVMIELSRDGGGSWETLFASTPNDGAEPWVVTGPTSDDCLLRVSSLDGLYSDVSDATFTILGQVTWLTVAPDTGSLDEGDSQPMLFGFDATGLADGVYRAWVVIGFDGAASPEIVPVTLTVSDPLAGVQVPGRFVLEGNYPNPFNPSTKIRFSLPEPAEAVVEVLDLQGRVVRTLHRGPMEAGPRDLSWDGRDDRGRRVASGAYLARLTSGGLSATHKMLLTK